MLTARKRMVSIAFFAFVLALSGSPTMAQDQAPAKFQAALFMKLLAFYTNLGSEPFTIHVVGAPDVAKELQAHVGKVAGKAKLQSVTEGSGPPSGKAHVIYVGNEPKAMTDYCQSNQVLSITGKPQFVNDGVTLGIGIEKGKAKILLNLSSSKAENINWNPQILKVASTIE